MCGIVGFNWVDPTLLKQMICLLDHRGPDEQGLFQDSGISLGQARLRIIDLETGNQPIANENESMWVICNGEIYNYQELRDALVRKGHHFSTESDTEVVVHAYEEWGDAFLDKLNGMFGLAIWDSNQKKLLLARDRIGIKPLFYYWNNHQLVFGSEMKAILRCADVDRRLNRSALSQFITYAYSINGETLFQDVYELRPGHYMVYQDDDISINCYWDLKAAPGTESLDYYVHKLRNHLESSVQYRLRSDVPVGAFLSGGLDSSIIVALMSQYMNDKINTFCIGFDDPSDETEYARAVAEHCDTNHHEVLVRFSEVVRNLGQLVWHMETPFARSSAICLYFLSREAKKKATVIPVGEGSDELFGGYNRDIPAMWMGKTVSEKGGTIAAGYFKENDAAKFFQESILSACPQNMRLESTFQHLGHGTSSREHLNQALLFETTTQLPGLQLFRSDRMSMAHAIETRVPFLDHDLVEFAMTIPAHYKVHGNEKKYVLKRAAADLLPPEILNRQKAPFGMPQARFYSEEMERVIKQVLLDPQTRKRDFLHHDYIESVVRSVHPQSITNETFRKLLFLTTLELWHRIFIDQGNIQSPELRISMLVN